MTRWYLDAADQILQGLYTQTQPSLARFIEGAGHLPDWDLLLMQTVYSMEPTLLHPDVLIERVPYTRPGFFLERLMAAAGRGWLYEAQGAFGLTNTGRETVEGVYELSDRLHARIKTLPGPDLDRLLQHSKTVIFVIAGLPEPAHKPAFELAQRYTRGPDTPTVVQVRQDIILNLAFHDDAHVAAWQPYESEGHLWEAFSLIWEEKAHTAAELVAQLPHRSYTKSDYTAALETLSSRGWIELRDETYFIQEDAARMRQSVETMTEQLSAAPFKALNPSELFEYKQLLERFAISVTPQENTDRR